MTETTIRIGSADIAVRLWQAVRAAGRTGLSASEAEMQGLASASYARKIMRAWASAGHATYVEAATPARNDSGYFTLAATAPAVPPVVTAAGVVADRTIAMSPAEFSALRRKAGLSLTDLGAALGWTGHRNSLSRAMRRFETGDRPIDGALAEKVRAVTGKVVAPQALSETALRGDAKT